MSEDPAVQYVLTIYRPKGWEVLPLPPRSKNPNLPKWQNWRLDGQDVRQIFTGKGVGLFLGDASGGLADNDIDAPEALAVASIFFPPTPMISGHPSNPQSHLWYVSPGLRLETFVDPLIPDKKKSMLLELRGNTKGGRCGLQTVVPPSLHEETGEPIQWYGELNPATVSADRLIAAAKYTAIAALLGRYWMANGEHGHDLVLASAGAFARARVPLEAAEKMIGAAARVAGYQRFRSSDVSDTFRNLNAHAHVTGWPKLAELVGDKVSRRLAEWVNYRESRIEVNSSYPVAAAASTRTVLQPEFPDDEEKPSPGVPPFPDDALEGDYISDLMHELSDGTWIPPQFVRENIKTILGALVNGMVGYPAHESIHTRHYHLLVSPEPESGKGQSWKRTGEKQEGFLNSLLHHEDGSPDVALLDGGLFGSGEYMAFVLSEEKNRRALVYWDEMSEVFEKAKNPGAIVEQKLLQLYDGGTISQGSFKNKTHLATGVELSAIGCFTEPGFVSSFTGRGSAGSGFLSRCILSFSNRKPHIGDWAIIDKNRTDLALKNIARTLRWLHASRRKIIVDETSEGRQIRLDAEKWIATLESHYTARLESHMKRDLILRALFSQEQKITADMALRGRLWVENQFANRLALWPEDSGNAGERMESKILSSLRKADRPLSDARLVADCHVTRPGSGGFECFRRAISALRSANEIQIVGKTRKNRYVYDLPRP